MRATCLSHLILECYCYGICRPLLLWNEIIIFQYPSHIFTSNLTSRVIICVVQSIV
jgi:hypothetical protein